LQAMYVCKFHIVVVHLVPFCQVFIEEKPF
jgi:hypothetical protein